MGLHEKHLDQWLDKALREYGAGEPRAGLETRVLANLESAERGAKINRFRWLGFAVAALAVCLILFIWIGMDRSPRQSVSIARSPGRGEVNAVPREKPVIPMEQALITTRRAKTLEVPPITQFAKEPRLSQFPSPQPLTEQEELLARYVQNFPQEARIVADEQARAEHDRQLEELAMDKSLESNSDQRER